MRLSSPFSDYYDGLQGPDREPEPVYRRETSEERLAKWPLLNLNRTGHSYVWTTEPNMEFLRVGCDEPKVRLEGVEIVGFCGRVYPVVTASVSKRGESGHYDIYDRPNVFAYNVEELDAVVRGHGGKRQVESYFDTGSKRHRKQGDRGGFVRLFDAYVKSRDAFAKLFGDRPSFRISAAIVWSEQTYYLRRDAPLGEVGFDQVFPRAQAWQEVRTYLSNIALPERAIPLVSNDDMAHAKGHGGKYSFRTRPSGKRAK